MAEVWGAALGAAVIGGGITLIGANKQAKADAAARAENSAAQAESERQNWVRYLMTRGITPSADTQTGVVPGATPGAPINTKLPVWAKVVTPSVPMAGARPSVPFLIKKGG
jgi:hypothetical protein